MAPQLVVAGGAGFVPAPPAIGLAMEDNDNPDEGYAGGPFILSAEESSLAELLGKLQHGDFARILYQLSPAAKDELRAAVGTLQAMASIESDDEENRA